MDCASQTDSYLEFEFRFHSVDIYEPARSCIYRNRLSFSFQGKVILDKGKAFGKKGSELQHPSYDDITADSKSLLYSGLSLTALHTLVQGLQPFKFSVPVGDQVLITLMTK